ncbi:MAG: ABC transporter permease [Furfurilactobacillus sp.]|jgi:peptide/nickel transport system permease protein|uniref:ABC transporter permease n=1 Tax=Furfurilactobacillus milii TaxID=2888272 RepID=A0ABT6D914_9LACO|nr:MULTISPECIES: ABC transporter permease [Furfurilactobacillus]QLE67227.1 Oligopeptide transport system permease protein OppC [Furfurilactobacillus rossiae]MCF6161081.1 ABC transporter permease [Furfurilactobacillus milii]MCF6163429.1 ABC transporter permease [Furfurilactobacillus milii]MCF6418769.1 ABC transporter permease [Furfurilactobacillus milii]MCH4011419.1 ABC transporter permease [Furfurilactobacillus sp.]
MSQNQLDNQSSIDKADLEKLSKEAEQEAAPSSLRIVWNEFKADKVALTAAVIIVVFILFVMIASLFINQSQAMSTNIMDSYDKPFSQFILGTDQGGRSVAKELIMGSKNSIGIAIGLTVISSTFGIVFGLVSGYFGGIVDNIMMRFYDFMMMLPILLFIIVVVTIIPSYNAITLTLILSVFYWLGTARLIRARTMSESKKDYVSASKTSGTSTFKIIFREIMPNISSLIIVDTMLSFAENIGVETTLSFLGFGLPNGTPSLGTMISNANDPNNITQYWWTWLIAAIEIIILTISISYVGQVIRRASDASQRLSDD